MDIGIGIKAAGSVLHVHHPGGVDNILQPPFLKHLIATKGMDMRCSQPVLIMSDDDVLMVCCWMRRRRVLENSLKWVSRGWISVAWRNGTAPMTRCQAIFQNLTGLK